MRPVVHAICLYLPFILCIPSIVLTIIAVWIIQKKSPRSMEGYKKYLIAITLATFNFDMGVSILIAPKFLPGAFGTENHGFIAMLWSSGGQYQLYYIMLSFILEYEFCVVGFSYREHNMIQEHTWKARSYRAFQFIIHFIFLALGTVTFFYQSVPEEEARIYMEQIQADYCRECSIQVIIDGDKTIYMAMLSLIGTVVLTSFVAISIHRIKQFLVAHHGSLSSSTIKLQKMLLKALIWQSFIPFILMAFPLTLGIVSFYAVPLVIQNFEPQTIQEDLTALALVMPSFFSIAHIFCNFWFTAPYKLYILRWFRPNSTLSPIAVTKTRATADPSSRRPSNWK